MSKQPSQELVSGQNYRLSPRARLLLWLERFFPVVENAPYREGENSEYEFRKAKRSYEPLLGEVGGIAGKTVLDFGCGWGGETVWLASKAREVVGCDVCSQALAEAERYAQRQGLTNVKFVQSTPDRLPLDSNRFDVVLSTNVFEHVMDVPAMLREIHRVLRPGGSFLTTFGPLFYSPLGYHLGWATQVPYAHLFFGLRPILEVRNLRRDPIDVQTCRTWQDTGLNMMTFRRFRRAVRDSGFEPRRLRRIPVRGMSFLAGLPIFGELFTFGVDCHLI